MKLTTDICLRLLILGLSFTASHTVKAAGTQPPFDDEFNQSVDLLSNNTTAWTVLGDATMDTRATEIIMDQGLMTVIPDNSIFHNGWFQDEYGPLIYQPVTGNFAAVVHLRVSSEADVDMPPDPGYNAAGFVIRDASGTHSGNENWVMYNMGGQGMNGVNYAREMKKTVNSTSNLFLTQQIGMEEYLLACRVGDNFYFYYWADVLNDGDGAWRQETFYNNFDVDGVTTTTWRNSSSVTPEIISAGSGQANPMHFNHPSMPETVQLGIMAHAYSNSENGTRGDYDFIRFAPTAPSTQNECTAAFEHIGNDLIFTDGFESQQ